MKRYLLSAIMTFAALGAAAQSLNSTVDVSNDYTNSFAGVSKSDIAMNIPDSLLQFNKDFDYSVFENPFKGSYEFVPYSVQLRPEPGSYGDRRFWLNAGAGWTMHPVLQAVYSPALAGTPGFKMSVYQDGSGYYGKYSGSDLNFLNAVENAGIDMHVASKGFNLEAGLGYEGIFAGPSDNLSMMHSGKANIRLSTVNGRFFGFRGDFSGRFAVLPDKRNEASFDLKMQIEPKIGKTLHFPIDLRCQMVPTASAYVFGVIPHVQLTLGPVELRAGVNLGFKKEDVANPISRNGFKIAPDVHAKLDIAKGIVTLFADVDGGSRLYSAADALLHNHFIYSPTAGAVDETIRFNGGLSGHITSHFQYSISGGYSIFASAPLDGPVYTNLLNHSSIVNLKFNMAYADALLLWRSERIDVDAGVHYRMTNLVGRFEAFDLPLLSGSLRVLYNYERRIFVGVSCEASAQRAGNVLYENDQKRASLPAYVDLGAYAEYKFTREFSVWLRGANLLNRRIFKIPIYAEQGIAATGGITLNF